uniref:Uncharacterized protein n=1 Tax=Catagonus wagneri TaxID=51154 RepID=A0A8C3YQF8_9CETA
FLLLVQASGLGTTLTMSSGRARPVALFPLWDPVSYFFRLWFGERNQPINDFFPPEATE